MSLDYQNRKALKGDRLAIDLNIGTYGNNIKFDISSNLDEKGVDVYQREYTFPDNGEVNSLDARIKNCVAQTAGENENDYVFLCDNNKLAFLTFEKTNGKVTSQQVLALDPSYKCQSLSTSPSRGKAYVACLKPDGTTLAVVKIDVALRSQQGNALEIPQTVAQDILSTNLRVLVDDYNYAEIADTVIYIYEEATGTAKVRFRLIKDRDQMVNGGFYSTANGSTVNLKDGILVGFYYDGQSVLIATRDESDNNFLQRCYRSPVMSKYNCSPNKIKMDSGKGIVRMDYVDPTLRTSRMMNVYLVNLNSVTIASFDPLTDTYSTIMSQDITGNFLKSLTEVYPVGDNYLYLVGPMLDGSPDINGVVQFSITASGYQQNDYRDGNPTLALVRRDYFNPAFANLIIMADATASFYIIKKDVLLINTNSFQDMGQDPPVDFSSIDYTVACTAQGAEGANRSFNLQTLMTVNGNASFSVPNVTAIFGSVRVPLPSDDELIEGNAPKLALLPSSAKGITMEYDLVVNATLQNNTASDMNVDHTRFIGNNIFVIYNDLFARFYQSTLFPNKTVGFNQSSYEIEMTTQRYVASMAQNNALITLTSTRLNGTQGLDQMVFKTAIEGIDLTDFSTRLFDPIVVDFYIVVGTVKIEGSQVSVYVIGSKVPNSPQGIYYMKFDLRNPDTPKNLTFVAFIGEHVCPKELSWAPKDDNHLYIGSICNDQATDSHVYQFEIDFDTPMMSAITNTYQITGSLSFRMCAQNRLVNIIDYQRGVVYSIDTISSIFDRYTLPLEEYGLTSLLAHSCNQDDNMLQVIASAEDGSNQLVVFRADDIEYPNDRVHSITPLGKQFVKLAATYSDDSDNIVMMLFGSTTATIAAQVISVHGPHIRLNTKGVTGAGDYNADFQLTLQGTPAVTVNNYNKVTLVAQQAKIGVSLKNPDNKPQADGSLVNLDNYVVMDGPYHTVDKTKMPDGITYSDRVTPSNQFAAVTDLFDDATFYQNYIFGYKNTTQGTMLILNNAEKPLLSISVGNVTSFNYVAKGTEVFFYALCSVRLENDRIYVFYYNKDQEAWINTDFELGKQGFQEGYFVNGPGDVVLFGAYNNDVRNEVYLQAFKLIDKSLQGYEPYTRPFENNIADYDLVAAQDSAIILIVGQEYVRQADFLWLELSDTNFILEVGSMQDSLVPNIIESHEGIALACQYFQNQSNTLSCVHSGRNAYSYVVNYQLSLDKMKTDQFITSSKVLTFLANIVNLTPVKVDYMDTFVSFLVKNEAPTASPGVVTYFGDAYILLVYKTDALAPSPAEEWMAPVRQAYKVLVCGDFGVPSRTNLVNMVPRFFPNSQGVVKLGVNIDNQLPNKTTSVRVFNLDPLSLSLKSSQANGNPSLYLSAIDDETYATPLSSIFSITNPTPEPEKPKKKSTLWILLAICLIVLITLVVGAVLIKMNRDKAKAEDNAIQDVEHTMKPADGQSVSGNYSKI